MSAAEDAGRNLDAAHAPEDGRGARSDPRPAVFLDRDGTLTVESDWVTSGADLVLVPGAA